MSALLRLVVFLIGIVSLVLVITAVFVRRNRDINEAKILETLALAFGMAGALAEVRKQL